MNAKERVLEKWKQMPEADKNLIRFYLQFSQEDLLTRTERFGQMAYSATRNKNRNEYVKQAELYGIAYFLKEHKISVKGGTRKNRKARRKTKKHRV